MNQSWKRFAQPNEMGERSFWNLDSRWMFYNQQMLNYYRMMQANSRPSVSARYLDLLSPLYFDQLSYGMRPTSFGYEHSLPNMVIDNQNLFRRNQRRRYDQNNRNGWFPGRDNLRSRESWRGRERTGESETWRRDNAVTERPTAQESADTRMVTPSWRKNSAETYEHVSRNCTAGNETLGNKTVSKTCNTESISSVCQTSAGERRTEIPDSLSRTESKDKTIFCSKSSTDTMSLWTRKCNEPGLEFVPSQSYSVSSEVSLKTNDDEEVDSRLRSAASSSTFMDSVKDRSSSQGTSSVEIAVNGSDGLSSSSLLSAKNEATEPKTNPWNWFSHEEQQHIVHMLKEVDVRHEQQLTKSIQNSPSTLKSPCRDDITVQSLATSCHVGMAAACGGDFHRRTAEGNSSILEEGSSSDDGVSLMLEKGASENAAIALCEANAVSNSRPGSQSGDNVSNGDVKTKSSDVPVNADGGNGFSEAHEAWGKFCSGWDKTVFSSRTESASTHVISLSQFITSSEQSNPECSSQPVTVNSSICCKLENTHSFSDSQLDFRMLSSPGERCAYNNGDRKYLRQPIASAYDSHEYGNMIDRVNTVLENNTLEHSSTLRPVDKGKTLCAKENVYNCQDNFNKNSAVSNILPFNSPGDPATDCHSQGNVITANVSEYSFVSTIALNDEYLCPRTQAINAYYAEVNNTALSNSSFSTTQTFCHSLPIMTSSVSRKFSSTDYRVSPTQTFQENQASSSTTNWDLSRSFNPCSKPVSLDISETRSTESLCSFSGPIQPPVHCHCLEASNYLKEILGIGNSTKGPPFMSSAYQVSDQTAEGNSNQLFANFANIDWTNMLAVQNSKADSVSDFSHEGTSDIQRLFSTAFGNTEGLIWSVPVSSDLEKDSSYGTQSSKAQSVSPQREGEQREKSTTVYKEHNVKPAGTSVRDKSDSPGGMPSRHQTTIANDVGNSIDLKKCSTSSEKLQNGTNTRTEITTRVKKSSRRNRKPKRIEETTESKAKTPTDTSNQKEVVVTDGPHRKHSPGYQAKAKENFRKAVPQRLTGDTSTKNKGQTFNVRRATENKYSQTDLSYGNICDIPKTSYGSSAKDSQSGKSYFWQRGKSRNQYNTNPYAVSTRKGCEATGDLTRDYEGHDRTISNEVKGYQTDRRQGRNSRKWHDGKPKNKFNTTSVDSTSTNRNAYRKENVGCKQANIRGTGRDENGNQLSSECSSYSQHAKGSEKDHCCTRKAQSEVKSSTVLGASDHRRENYSEENSVSRSELNTANEHSVNRLLAVRERVRSPSGSVGKQKTSVDKRSRSPIVTSPESREIGEQESPGVVVTSCTPQNKTTKLTISEEPTNTTTSELRYTNQVSPCTVLKEVAAVCCGKFGTDLFVLKNRKKLAIQNPLNWEEAKLVMSTTFVSTESARNDTPGNSQPHCAYLSAHEILNAGQLLNAKCITDVLLKGR